MKFSKKSRYGIAALIYMCANCEDKPVALNVVAEKNDISLQYLEQIFSSLKKKGIVKSIKGPQGGYFIGADSQNISVANIVEAIEGNYHVEGIEANQREKCAAYGTVQSLIIDKVNDTLDETLRKITLAELTEEYKKQSQGVEMMYYI